MKSIQSKIVIFMLLYLVLLALIIGAISVINTNRVSANDSEIMVNETCSEQVMQLDFQLKIVSRAVDTILGCAADQLESADRLLDREYLETYTDFVRRIAVDLAVHTDGAITAYFRYNPNLVQSGKEGFYWLKQEGDTAFTEMPTTDLLAFGAEEIEHVEWYYIPVRAGKETWITPYYDQNIGKEIISYVAPFYKDNQLIGVIGMDIDFGAFVELAQDVELYEGSQVRLVDIADKEMYLKTEEGIGTAALDDSLCNILNVSLQNGKLHRVEYGERKHVLAFGTLSNHMKLVILAPVAEINKNRNHLLINTVTVAMIIFALAFLTGIFVAKRIVKPLKELTVASEQFAEGNWHVSIECHTKDEVKRLTDSVLVMARKTQEYINQLNLQAMRDGLTGVKNKACYLDTVQNLKAQESEETVPLAVVFCDINFLKKANDTYGHEFGDELIMTACQVICRTFCHSPVFRVGGDEFVVIVQNTDYEMRDALMAKLERDSYSETVFEGKDIVFSLAHGMASVPEDAGDYDAAFALAEERMYARKSKMKGGEPPR